MKISGLIGEPGGRRLVCIGAGPKTMAVLLLATILRRLGMLDLAVLVVERIDLGANWSGQGGFTDGRFPLDTSPLKDLGFPYDSGFGPEVDHELSHYSYIDHMKRIGRFSDWVSRGQLATTHAEFAEYLRWVGGEIGVDGCLVRGELRRIVPTGAGVTLELATPQETTSLAADAVMLTGPGEAKRVAFQDDEPRLIHDARTYWRHRRSYRELDGGRVAVLGGGQSAGTVAKSLTDENPGLRVDVINRQGFLAAQSAGFTENALCTTARGWDNLSRDERREFLKRTNNGVISAEIKAALDRDPRVRVLRGSVREVRAGADRVRLVTSYPCREVPAEYDRVVVAIGFDPIAQLGSLLPDDLRRSAWFAGLADGPDLDHHLRLRGLDGSLHMPSLAGPSQGPGFALLSCLGTLARRVVSAYGPTPETAANSPH